MDCPILNRLERRSGVAPAGVASRLAAAPADLSSVLKTWLESPLLRVRMITDAMANQTPPSTGGVEPRAVYRGWGL
jgi:hypothetical protein